MPVHRELPPVRRRNQRGEHKGGVGRGGWPFVAGGALQEGLWHVHGDARGWMPGCYRLDQQLDWTKWYPHPCPSEPSALTGLSSWSRADGSSMVPRACPMSAP